MERLADNLSLPVQDLEHILTSMDGVWDAFRDKSIFITGGTGFFGKWIVESLLYASNKLNLSCKVTLLSRDPAEFIANHPYIANSAVVSFIRGDVRSFSDVDQSFDYIIHAATDVEEKNSALDTFDVIVNGTRRILELAKKCQVQGVLLTSSGAVYGAQPSTIEKMPETYLGGPSSVDLKAAYGLGKKTSEWLSVAYGKQYDLPIKIARCYAFVGPYLPIDKHFAIGNFIRDSLNCQPIQIRGDGTPYRSYLYAADLVVWLLIILIKGRSYEAYNVGSDQSISIYELGTLIKSIGNSSGVVSVEKQAPLGHIPERYIPDINKAEKELGLKVLINLPDSIKRTINWHLDKSKLNG